MSHQPSTSRVMHPGAVNEDAIIKGARLVLHYYESRPLSVLVISEPFSTQYGPFFRAVVDPDKYTDEQLEAAMAGNTQGLRIRECSLADLGLIPYGNEQGAAWNPNNYITRM